MNNLGYNNGRNFLKSLSSFWTKVYEDSAFVGKLSSGYGELFSQAYFSFLEAVLGNSIKDIPVFDKKKWFFLTLKSSENLFADEITYSDEGITYGPQSSDSKFTTGKVFEYGGKLSSDKFFRFKLPGKMVNIDRFIMNRIYSPSLVLTKDTDFTINSIEQTITFNIDPFENDLLATRVIRDSEGNQTDTEVGLWCLNSFWDYEYVWQNYGKPVGFYRPSSEEYKTFIKAIWTLFYGGPSFSNVESGINSVLGLPVASDNETILSIKTVNGKHEITTSVNFYEIEDAVPLRSSFFSSEGALKPDIQLKPFDSLTDVVSIKDNKSHPNWWKDIQIQIPSNLMEGDKDFLLPENVKIYANMRIGDTWGLPLEHDSPNSSFREMGLRVGEWIIGKEDNNTPLSYSFDFKQYVMENFFKENLFLMTISPTIYQLTSFEKQVIKIINEALPSYCTFLNYTYLDSFNEDYLAEKDVDGIVSYNTSIISTLFDKKARIGGHNTENEILDPGIGLSLEEFALPATDPSYSSSSEMGYDLGFTGFPFIGYTNVGQFTVGTYGFQGGLQVRSKCN